MLKFVAPMAVMLLLSSPALAADLRGEIMNAAEHAEYSGEATTLDEALVELDPPVRGVDDIVLVGEDLHRGGTEHGADALHPLEVQPQDRDPP